MCWCLGPGAEKSWDCGPWGISGGGFLHHLPHPGCLPDPGNTHAHAHAHSRLTNVFEKCCSSICVCTYSICIILHLSSCFSGDCVTVNQPAVLHCSSSVDVYRNQHPTVEKRREWEATFTVFVVKVSALCSAGGEHNLILLDRSVHKPNPVGTVGWAGSTFGPLHKSRLGEQEFEALMRTLDNLVSDGTPNGEQCWDQSETWL